MIFLYKSSVNLQSLFPEIMEDLHMYDSLEDCEENIPL